MLTPVIIYCLSALLCKWFIAFIFRMMPEQYQKFTDMMNEVGIEAPVMINIICLAPLLNTGMIIIWIIAIINAMFSKG